MNDKFQNLINSNKPVLLDFYADWCGPCQAMKPILVQLKEKVGEDAIIVKIDTEKIKICLHIFRLEASLHSCYTKKEKCFGDIRA
jgi:thioredoxin 1